MNDSSSRRFVSSLRSLILGELKKLYGETKAPPRVGPGLSNFYSFTLQKQQIPSEIRDQFEQHLPPLLVTEVYLNPGPGDLSVQHPGNGGEDHFQVVELGADEFGITENGRTLHLDELAGRVYGPIYEAPGTVG
jgi:hypothetical protein